MTPPPRSTAPVSTADALARTIGLALHQGIFRPRKQASLSRVTVDKDEQGRDADKELLGLRKTVLVSPELKAVAGLDNEVKEYLRTVVLPTPMAFNVWLLPVDLLIPTDQRLRAYAARRADLVDACVSTMPRRWADTCERLGVLQADREQPSLSDFRASFHMSWEYVEFSTPQSLRRIDDQLFQDQVNKAQARLDQVVADCKAAMRHGLSDLVTHLVDSLSPGPDGKHRRFHPSMVSHLGEFLKTFEARNVADDHDLAALAGRAQQLLRGVDTSILKDDTRSRTLLARQFTAIQAALRPIVGVRAIQFDDDQDQDQPAGSSAAIAS